MSDPPVAQRRVAQWPAAQQRFGRKPRLPVVLVVAGLLLLGGLLDRTEAPGGSSVAVALPQVPVAAPAGALSSSWFCAGATDNANGAAPAMVVIANANAQPVTATVTLIPDQGPPSTATVGVPARNRVAVPESLPGASAWIGANVTINGGSAAVEQQVSGPLGRASSPCATSSERRWFFADGRTAINASDEITLLNPYPMESIVDLSFTTDQGLEAPGEFQALVVPASGLLSVDLGTHLRRRLRIATVVTARTGRVVAWQTQVVTPPSAGQQVIGPNGPPPGAIDPASPVPGVTLSLGSSSAATTWTWPEGIAGGGVEERYVIFNPGPGTAQVRLALELDQGRAEPFTLSVGPEEVSTVVSDQQARVPAGVTHAATLRSVNGVRVIAERAVAASPPSARAGLGVLAGERLASSSWLFPGGSAGPRSDEVLVLFNPGPVNLTASVSALAGSSTAPLPGLAGVAVAPGARVALRINDRSPTLDAALVVQASGPLFVERDLYGLAKQPGYSLSAGVPLQP